MSETTQKPEAPPEPPEEPGPAPAPAEQPEPQPPSEGDQPPDAEGEEKRIARRLNRLNSRVAMLSRTNEQLQQQLAQALQQRAQQTQAGQQVDPALQQYIEQQVAAGVQARVMDQKTRAFHEQGSELYPDWNERCTALQAMGADAQIARVLVGMRDGPRVAAALHDAPDELDRIAAMDTEDRATALGEFAAKLKTQSMRPVSKAPKPPPVVTQRAAPTFDPYRASTEELLKQWSRPGARPP